MKTILSSFTGKERNLILAVIGLWAAGSGLTYFYPSEYKSLEFENLKPASISTGDERIPEIPGITKSGLIDINTANEAALDSLPGVGPSTAKAIIEWRTKNGLFQSPNDLDNVPGIGPAKLQRLLSSITVTKETTGAMTAVQSKERTTQPVTSLAKININTAPAGELVKLVRIGPALAQRIIDFRTKNGPFPTIESLNRVSGIGPKTIDANKDLISLR